MDKIMIITKDTSDTIILTVNGVEKLSIPKNNREINAQQIYNCFSYEIGDSYSIEPLDEGISNDDVVMSFGNLIIQISQSLNELTCSVAIRELSSVETAPEDDVETDTSVL